MRRVLMAAVAAAVLALAGQASAAVFEIDGTISIPDENLNVSPGDAFLKAGVRTPTVDFFARAGDTVVVDLTFASPFTANGLDFLGVGFDLNGLGQPGSDPGSTIDFLDAGGATLFTATNPAGTALHSLNFSATLPVLSGAPTTFSGLRFTSAVTLASVDPIRVRAPVFFQLDAASVSQAGLFPVPEPSTWALMILGFGVVGAVARRRRQALVMA